MVVTRESLSNKANFTYILEGKTIVIPSEYLKDAKEKIKNMQCIQTIALTTNQTTQ
jgi:hypothetical protein